MDQTGTGGGSNAQDFQPRTRNPQNDVGGGLQPNVASPNSLFQQPGANQQMLPSTNSLRVLNNGTRNTSSPAPATINTDSSGWDMLPFGFVVIIIFGAVIMLGKNIRSRSNEAVKSTEFEIPSDPTIAKPAPKKAKKKSKAKRKKI